LAHLEKFAPEVPVQRQLVTADGRSWVSVLLENGCETLVRVFHFLQGVEAQAESLDRGSLYELGREMARLDHGLRGFCHVGAMNPVAWDIQRFDKLHEFLGFVADPDERALLERVFKQFNQRVKPVLRKCRAQIIHNDISYHNIVVHPGQPTRIAGFFDFGDMTFAPLVQEIAVSAAEFAAGAADPLASSAALVAGYHEITPLEETEFELLPALMRARLAMGCVISAWTDKTNQWTDDRPHLDGWQQNALQFLKLLDQKSNASVVSLVKSACGIAASANGDHNTGKEASDWERRKRYLGNADYYSYSQPLSIVRGQGVWLYDKEGVRYLDAYNNVPHVGHCHPRVVNAIARQTARLNTNTRYMYDQLPDYAEKLVATLPEGLDTCYFVSSGSEANDLAWRMAKAWTGQAGGLVLKSAYHGVTDAVFDLSPAEKAGRENTCRHIVELEPPDDFRGKWKRDEVDRGSRYAAYCDDAIDQLASNGYRPAAFFMDMIMSTNGIVVPPPGYLSAVFEKVRAAGGLCVADEVQSGFGRLGKSMWGFEVAGAVPDFVTFGKPIAGGYPMGLVVTRREIAQRFEQSCEFFSTTGGNPVACAAALAVLNIVQEEGLMENAERNGSYLMENIQALARHNPCVGDVRGSGLFIGIDLISDTDTLAPDADLAHAVENGLKDSGVLIGVDGIHANVLKVRPPMVVKKDHCDLFLGALNKVLASQYGK